MPPRNTKLFVPRGGLKMYYKYKVLALNMADVPSYMHYVCLIKHWFIVFTYIGANILYNTLNVKLDLTIYTLSSLSKIYNFYSTPTTVTQYANIIFKSSKLTLKD